MANDYGKNPAWQQLPPQRGKASREVKAAESKDKAPKPNQAKPGNAETPKG